MRSIQSTAIAISIVCLCAGFTFAEQRRTRAQADQAAINYLKKEVRKELVTLPYYNVFDWLEAEVTADGVVYLRGQVIRPTTRSDAEKRVKKIEGVEKVINRIETLPLSPNDDRIRKAVYYTLFGGNSPLFRYGRAPVPSIHIIVKNGNVTLKGLVDSKADSDMARLRANGVPGVFSVRNELKVEKSG